MKTNNLIVDLTLGFALEIIEYVECQNQLLIAPHWN
jgi:hypothetical protein